MIDDDYYYVEDDDTDIEAEGDVCDRCGDPREAHEDGGGECTRCGKCRRFRTGATR